MAPGKQFYIHWIDWLILIDLLLYLATYILFLN